MSTVTIPQKEYRELVEKRVRYEQLREFFEEDIFSPPPTKKNRRYCRGISGYPEI